MQHGLHRAVSSRNSVVISEIRSRLIRGRIVEPKRTAMGRIIASVRIDNASDVSKGLSCDALVDTGASLMVLPSACKDRLVALQPGPETQVETAPQQSGRPEGC